MSLAVVLVLALLVGVAVGLLGGGGSVMSVPLLAYVAGLDAKVAIATSLLLVAVTSAVGVVIHARAGRVRWRTGVVFGVAGMVGAYGGGRLAAFVPGTVLLLAFAAMMLLAGIAMLRGRRRLQPHRPDDAPLPIPRIAVEGAVVGAATGLVGAGGGFLIVPALVLLGGLPMAAAVGTSLLVITLKSTAGLAGYLASTPVDWSLAVSVTAAAVVGVVVGSRLVGRVPEARLRRVFGWTVLAVALVVVGEELPGVVGATAVTPWMVPAAGAGAILLAGAVRALWRPRKDPAW